jgi:hypothetical protein
VRERERERKREREIGREGRVSEREREGEGERQGMREREWERGPLEHPNPNPFLTRRFATFSIAVGRSRSHSLSPPCPTLASRHAPPPPVPPQGVVMSEQAWALAVEAMRVGGRGAEAAALWERRAAAGFAPGAAHPLNHKEPI